MKTLFEHLRSEANLFAAWRHVKRSALNSPNNEIKGDAAKFEHQHQRYIKRLASQLREGSFKFNPVKGVLKDKKKRLAQGKDPRPIAILSIPDRVIQRALLQVLQPRNARNEKDPNTKYEPSWDRRLGQLNEISRSPYGVGGLMHPYGGVRPAIQAIMNAMSKGARYYYQSDIKAFFTKIPTTTVVAKINHETKDDRLSELFSLALDIELANEDELLSYAKLFPSGGIGVAQGSSLSALAGNILLYDFDHKLNQKGVTAIRYIDDILIVAESEDALEDAIKYSQEQLSAFGFSLYVPAPGSDKASRGECRNGFNFLGCTLQPNRCVPSRKSIDKLINDVNDAISSSKKSHKLLCWCRRRYGFFTV
jgi:RNA-directed DNA polymerase